MSIFDAAEARVDAMRVKARNSAAERETQARRSGYSHGMGSMTTPFDSSATHRDDASRSQRQYEAFKDTAFTTIRPLAVKGSQLSIRCGVEKRRRMGAKDARVDAMIDNWLATNDEWIAERKRIMPDFCKDISDSIDPLKEHFLLSLLANPNEHLTGNKLKYLSIASMALTGRFVWWFDNTGDTRKDAPELGNLRLWYIPRNWVRPAEGNRFGQFRIQAPGQTGSVEVDVNQLFMSTIPSPDNPFAPHSPLQTQAKSIDTDDKILRAQAVSLDNAMRPNLILSVGKIPGQPGMSSGSGVRPILSANQREQLIDTVKLMHQGVQRYGEPLILDGLIENVHPYLPGPAELDMINSSESIKRRIMEGLGVSPVVAGYTENANRAGSVIAKEVFYDIALNPMISMISEDMDSILGPRFSLGGPRLRIWMETAEAVDPDAVQSRVAMVKENFTPEELRAYALSGKLKLDDAAWKKHKEERDAAAKESAASMAADRATRDAIEGKPPSA